MSTNATLLVVVGGADEAVEGCVGTEVPSTAAVVGVGGVFVGTVVRGGGTALDVLGVVVDVDLGVVVDVDADSTVGVVTSDPTGVPDDADVEGDESSPSLHPPAATTRSASTTLDREIIRSIMSSWVHKVSAVREDRARLEIANFTIHASCDSTSTGQEPA